MVKHYNPVDFQNIPASNLLVDGMVKTTEQATKPATPANGSGGFYFKTDNLPYAMGDDGVERPLIRVTPAVHDNPGFDGTWVTNATHGLQPPGWDEFWQAASIIDAYDTVDFISGGGSCKMTQPATGATVQTAMQNANAFGVHPGDILTVSVWAKTNLPSPSLGIVVYSGATVAAAQPFGGGSGQSRAFAISATWALYQASFTIPPGETFARISFQGSAIGAGDWWLDESGSTLVSPPPTVNAWAKEPVRCLVAAGFNPATGAPLVVDGLTLLAGDRVLRANPGGSASDGLYTVATPGTGSNGTWVRANDALTSTQVAGAEVAVLSGTVYAGTHWVCVFRATDTIDSTSMVWYRIRSEDTGWQNVSFGAGYAQYGGFRACQFRKVGDRVDMRGLANCAGGVAASAPIFTLPVGYRPSAPEILSTNMYGPASYADVGLRLDVATSGAVSSQRAMTAGGYVSLSGCFFYAD